MNLSFFIARRYLISKKSNNAINIISWISIVAIAFTTAALVIILSAMNGLTSTVASLYHAFEPDLKVTPKYSKYISNPDQLQSQISNLSGIRLVSASLQENALIKLDEKQAVVTVKGVDVQFKNLNQFDTVVTDGVYQLKSHGQNYAIFGRGIAGRIGLNVHDFITPISIYAPKRGKIEGINPDEAFNELTFSPAGTFALNDDFDFKYVLIDLKAAQELFDCPQQISSFEIACKKGEDIESIQEDLKKQLGDQFEVKTRYQLNDVLFKTLETEKLLTFLILGFILVVATFNIIGALTMLIIEKKNDLKTFYHMGANHAFIRTIFMKEGFLITIVGAGSGLIIGILVCWLQIKFHFVKFDEQYVIPYYPIEMQLKDLVWIAGLVMSIGFLAALYPVRVFTKNDLVHQ